MANILIAIAGLSPQVITETLYALHQEGTRIDEIHVIPDFDSKQNNTLLN